MTCLTNEPGVHRNPKAFIPMTFQIVHCGHCGALVLSDSLTCHVCHHTLDRTSEPRQVAVNVLPTDAAVAEDLEVCGSCGETYRTGLVRCWNCGAFTRKEIEAAFEKMLERQGGRNQEQILLPELNAALAEAGGDDDWLPSMSSEGMNSPESFAAADGSETAAGDEDFDFELSDDVSLTDWSEPGTPQVPATPEERLAAEEEGYRLLTSPVEEPPVAASTMSKTPQAEMPVVAGLPPLMADETGAIPSLPEVSAAVVAASGAADAIGSAASTGAGSATGAGATASGDSTTPVSSEDEALLKIARAEEREIAKTKKTYREAIKGGFVVFCPMGCKIRVQDRHRGKAGKCPKCGSVFFVPAKPTQSDSQANADTVTAVDKPAPWSAWLNDVHVHTVIPTKLRIKPGSLANEFDVYDVVVLPEGVLLLSLVAGKGMFGAADKKRVAARAAAQDHLKSGGKLEALTVASQKMLSVDQVRQIAMAQPTPSDVESLFGEIPVFGAWRIAVKFPRMSEEPGTQYASFWLSEFRTLSQAVQTSLGLPALGERTAVPLQDKAGQFKCHYTETPVFELGSLDYYQADPVLKPRVTLSGWRCAGCKLIVSETGRRKEKLGGLNGKGIAKAKCPKCGNKFGNQPLYQLASEPAAASASATATAGAAASAELTAAEST
jgi:uncharacterized OB-fold protein